MVLVIYVVGLGVRVGSPVGLGARVGSPVVLGVRVGPSVFVRIGVVGAGGGQVRLKWILSEVILFGESMRMRAQ